MPQRCHNSLIFCGLFCGIITGVLGKDIRHECPENSHFLCSNERCLPISVKNNSVNDCEDNSDEVRNPCRNPMFSCKNDRCTLMERVLDGNNDCVDASDEAKLIGTRCRVDQCCPCEDFVPHSSCVGERCQCNSGYYSNDLGTLCLPRVVGSSCTNDSDCVDSIALSYCQASTCVCPPGYGSSEDGRACRKRGLMDDCVTDLDCLFIVNGRCYKSQCACNHGFSTDKATRTPDASVDYSTTDLILLNSPEAYNNISASTKSDLRDSSAVCRPNFLNDSCTLDNNCFPENSLCINKQCACPMGYYASKRNDTNFKELNQAFSDDTITNTAFLLEYCQIRAIGQTCIINEDCNSVIGYSHCDVTNSCSCAHDYEVNALGQIICLPDRTWISVIIIMLCTATIGCLCILDLFLIAWMSNKYVIRKRTRKKETGKALTSCNGRTSFTSDSSHVCNKAVLSV